MIWAPPGLAGRRETDGRYLSCRVHLGLALTQLEAREHLEGEHAALVDVVREISIGPAPVVVDEGGPAS